MRIVGCLVLVIVACGPSSARDDDAPSGDDSTGAPSCEMYEPEPIDGVLVDIVVRNEGALPLYFRPEGCGLSMVVDITPPGEDAPVPRSDLCTPSCAGFLANQSCDSQCPNCGTPNAGRIDGGVTSSTGWAGVLAREMELVDACAPAADCPATCLRVENAAPGTYLIEVPAFRTCTGVCECEPGNGPGACGIYGEQELSSPGVLIGVLAYPEMTSIELVITD